MTRESFFAAVDRWRHTPTPDDRDRDDDLGDELADRETKPGPEEAA